MSAVTMARALQVRADAYSSSLPAVQPPGEPFLEAGLWQTKLSTARSLSKLQASMPRAPSNSLKLRLTQGAPRGVQFRESVSKVV